MDKAKVKNKEYDYESRYNPLSTSKRAQYMFELQEYKFDDEDFEEQYDKLKNLAK